jgi:hypothetical protein
LGFLARKRGDSGVGIFRIVGRGGIGKRTSQAKGCDQYGGKLGSLFNCASRRKLWACKVGLWLCRIATLSDSIKRCCRFNNDDLLMASFVPRPIRKTPHIIHTSLRLWYPRNMSFLGGAECSTAGNPLSQFTKHVQDDKSLQRDRLVGSGPGGLQESFRSLQNGGGQDEVCRRQALRILLLRARCIQDP